MGVAAVTLVLMLAAGVSAWADVVELTTGERVEGKAAKATDERVSVDVGGQTLTFDRQKVRAIYFGSGPGSAAAGARLSPGREAVQIVKAVESATRAGLTYRDYLTRTADAQVQLDRHLQEVTRETPQVATAIVKAMTYYTQASRAWRAQIGYGKTEEQYSAVYVVLLDPPARDCPRIRKLTAGPRPEDSSGQMELVGSAVPTVWACASDEIAEAERLLGQK
jgi:hypothetical protein